MKSVKKFSAMSAKDQPITESAKVSQEAVEELIKKIGFNSIEELKKEKDLLSKLEALSKSFANKDNISEEDLEEDRAEDIEDELKAKGKPKSLEGKGAEKEGDEEVAAEVEEVEEDTTDEEIEDDLVSDEQEVTKEVPAEEDEVSDEDGVPVADEEVETPKATKRIMAFEDFIKEKTTTINKNVSYRDDNEEEEDYAVPVAASADPLAESDESRGKDDEKEGDELEDKGDKKVDSEDDKEKADHYKGAVKSDDKQIDALKKDAEYDKEEEEKNESTIMDFASFVNEAYDKVVWGGNKGDDSESEEDEEDYDKDESVEEDRAEDIEDEINAKGKTKKLTKSVKEAFTFADAVDTAGEDVKKSEKGIASALKALKAKSGSDISIMTDTTEDDGLWDAIEGMKELSINSPIYDIAYVGKYKNKDVVVFNDGEDLFAYVKEAFTFADAVDTAGEDVKKNEKGIASALKALRAKGGSDITIMTDTTEDDGLYDAVKGMKTLPITSTVYDKAYTGKYKGKDVVVFDGGDDLFAYVKEGAGEVITKVTGDEIADEVAGADGLAIPVIKGDGSETAAGIAGDIMNKGKVKNLSALAGKLVTPDQKVTEVIPDEANDVEDGIEIPLVKEAKINEEDITSDDQFKEYATAVLKKAFGDDYDEAKAMEVVDGLIAKHDGDYGAMIGALQSSIG